MRAILLGPELGPKKKWNQLIASISFHPHDLLVGVDGGTGHWFKIGKIPDLAVGDWDSLRHKNQILSQIPHLTLSPSKDRSDLFYAIIAAMKAGADEILCLGVTGGRPDHHFAVMMDLANFSSGQYGKLKSVQAKGVDGDYFFLSDKIPVWRGKLHVGSLVSVFALDKKVRGVTLKGFRYPLDQADLLPSSLGLSNQVIKRNCEVRLRNGKLLVILPRNGCE